jgi:hypothetical protein
VVSASFTFPIETSVIARRAGLTPQRCQLLAQDLGSAAEALWRRKASEVPAGHLDAYVTLRWMRWQAGALELTEAGQAIRSR